MEDLSEYLKDKFPEGGEQSFRLYEMAKASEWKLMPRAGGILDQPAYLMRDFEYFMLLETLVELNEELPSSDGLPRVEEMGS